MSLALLCPGQGGQHPAMFSRLQADTQAAELLAAAHGVLGEPLERVAGAEQRYANHIAQPLVCAGALAHWLALQQRLPLPVAVLGYSVGELAAHAVAGSIDAAACLHLASTRARLMDAASPAESGLLAVLGLDRQALVMLCARHGVEVAIDNAQDHCIVGGLHAALQAIASDALEHGARTQLLPVTVPAHTHWLRPAADDFAQVLRAADVRAPAHLLLAGCDALPVTSRERVIATLAAQIGQTICWRAVLQQAVERGARVLLELGPGAALSRIAREAYPELEARSVDDFQSLDGIAEWVECACARAH